MTDQTKTVAINSIRTDGGTQARGTIHAAKVEEYAAVIEEGEGRYEFPPVDVFYDGTDYWLADGFHRVAAQKQVNGNRGIMSSPMLANIHQGTRRDAILFAAGANATHGLPRTADDKRRAVETLLRDEAWGKWSDREIGRRCHVSPTFVGKIRAEVVTVHVDSERTYTTKHGTEAKMRTANTGRDTDQATYLWLSTYTDKNGRSWRDLSDSQIHHANSPCYQAFVTEFPNLTDPKLYLKRALARLKQELFLAGVQSVEDEAAVPPSVAQMQLAATLAYATGQISGEEFDQVAKQTAVATPANLAISAEAEAAPDEIEVAIQILKQNQRQIETFVIKTTKSKVAALCAKAANTISYLINDLQALDKS